MRLSKKERVVSNVTRIVKRLRFEQLEEKRLLAITWANQFGTGADDPVFNLEYGANEVIARALVNRAIDDWNKVILDQNLG